MKHLSSGEISKFIKTKGVFLVESRGLVTSTNTILKAEAAKGAPEGYVLTAEAQTSGKGRQGNSWFSPYGSGVYFSVILKPEIKPEEATLITAAAAVASALAIKDVFNVETGIKWVNDLYLDNKKISGILNEATVDPETGLIDYIILGIGINITKPVDGYPEELSDIISAISNDAVVAESKRCKLIAAVLDKFWQYYINLSGREFLDEYRNRSVLLGKMISVSTNNDVKKAKALSIDDDCGLFVRFEDGKTETLRSGTVRLIDQL